MTDTMTTADPIQEEIIRDFELFDEWLDKYDYLIDLGNALPPIDPAHRNDQYVISGCQSRAWLDARMDDEGRMWFSADGDAIIGKGIMSLILKVVNGRTPREIIDADLYFVDRIGLRENLSPTRANGLAAMLKQMKLYALAFENKKS